MSRRYVNPGAVTRSDPQQQQFAYAQTPAAYPTAQNPVVVAVQNLMPWHNPNILTPNPPPEQPDWPPYFKTTVSQFPANKSVLENCGIPIGVLVSPAMASDVPVIDMQNGKLTRCGSCLSYLSPFHKILQGNTLLCPFCGKSVELLDSTIRNINELPELMVPVYDVRAPKSFISLPDSGPSFCFIFDMTREAVQSGFTLQMINSAKSTIDNMCKQARIAILTMGSTLCAYSFSDHAEAIICDQRDIYIPSTCVATLGDVVDDIKAYLDYLLTNPGAEASNCLFGALSGAISALKGSGGVIIAGCYGIPSGGAYGIIARQVTPNASEADLFKLPQDEASAFVRTTAKALNTYGFSLHLFVTPKQNQPIELPIISTPCGLTGGQCHFYPRLDEFALMDLHNDMFRTLTQEYFWDCSMRLRSSNGIGITGVSGNLIYREETVNFPIMQGQSTVAFELNITGEVSVGGVLLQLAILWTNSQRERMIRIFNFRLPLSTDIKTIGQTADEASIATLLCKQATTNLLKNGPVHAAGELKKVFANMYSRGHRFVSLPYLIHSALSCDLLCVPCAYGVDGRFTTIIEMRSCNVVECLLKLYPRFFCVERMDALLPLTQQSFYSGNVFVFHTYNRILIWVSPATTPDQLSDIFGVSSLDELPLNLPQTGTPINSQLHEKINECYMISGRYLPHEIIRGGNNSEREFQVSGLLLDDNNSSGSSMDAFLSQYR